MLVTRSVDVDAPPSVLWAVVADVESLPSLTESMDGVRIVGGGPLALGSEVEIRQPGLPKATWTVTGLEAGHSFTWTSTAPGIRTVASHEVHERAGGSTLSLRLEQTGPLGGLISLLMGAKVRRYVELEAAGLKAAAEAR